MEDDKTQLENTKKRISELEQNVSKYRKRVIALKKDADPDACDCSAEDDDLQRCIICDNDFCANCYKYESCICGEVICEECCEDRDEMECNSCCSARCDKCLVSTCPVCRCRLCKDCSPELVCCKCDSVACVPCSPEHEKDHLKDWVRVYLALVLKCLAVVLDSVYIAMKPL